MQFMLSYHRFRRLFNSATAAPSSRIDIGRPLWTYSSRLTRSNFLQRVIDIVQLSDKLYYALPERPMNGLLIYNALLIALATRCNWTIHTTRVVRKKNYNAL